MLKVIRGLLQNFIDNIDGGNSNITEEDGIELIRILQSINDPYLSKYQACEFLNISRATFDNLVRDGKMPRGIKRSGFKELAWKKTDLVKYLTKDK